MPRLEVPQLNMPESIKACEEQIIILNFAWWVAFDSAPSSDYCKMIHELYHLVFKQYRKLGGEKEQVGDIAKYGRSRVLEQVTAIGTGG